MPMIFGETSGIGYIQGTENYTFMKVFRLVLCLLFLTNFAMVHGQRTDRFDMGRDLLLANYNCKTDVDDLHSAAALATILNNAQYSDIQYHAVAGTYGIQEGLYVPPNDLFELAFGDNWTDAHTDRNAAVEKVKRLVSDVLISGGDIWVAEAGQSDFTAELIRRLTDEMPGLALKQRIHVVQHSDWNEEVTTTEDLAYVKLRTDYHKIDDGNAVGNGTPGFRTPEFSNWEDYLSDPQVLAIWKLAVKTGKKYNGKEGRYNNEAVESGGLDFSDTSEICWMFSLEDIQDTKEFFERFGE